MSTQLISPLRVSPDAALRCKGCSEYVAVLENLNVVLHGNATVNEGSIELSPVLGLYHAPCWAKEVNHDLLAALKEAVEALSHVALHGVPYDPDNEQRKRVHQRGLNAIAKTEEES